MKKWCRSRKEDLKETKAELESQKVELEGLKEQQTAQLQSMKDKKDEVQALLDGLDQDVKDLIAKRDVRDSRRCEAEEEARRAAEEAA